MTTLERRVQLPCQAPPVDAGTDAACVVDFQCGFVDGRIVAAVPIEDEKAAGAVLHQRKGDAVHEFSCTSFIAILQHLASWGFIAAGNDALNSGSGETAAKTLEKMLSENEKQGSLFHDRIDLDHIGGIGYFQGGAGAIRQATISKNKDHYSALYLASPMTLPFIEKAKAAAWSYDPSQITVPVFIASGGDGIENGILAPKEDMEGIYQAAKGPAVIGRMKGEDHLRVMTRADAYMTAWFRMILSGDEKAASIFGKDGEFMKNAGWTDKSIKGIPLEGNE